MDKRHNIFNFSLLQKIEILFKQKGIDNPEKERKAKMSKQTQSIAKPFCKVCHDAGKTVAEYSTHYVRESRGGAVVCPTILNQQCNYCKKHGHTPSHCPALQAKQGQAKQGQAKQGQAHEAKQVQAKQVQAHEAKQGQAKQTQAKQVQAQAQARLCELPQMENNILVPVIKPVALKMKSWASVVSKKPAPAQEEQAQRAQAQEEQAQEQAPEEQEQEQAQRVQAQEEQERAQAQAPEEQAPEEQEQEQAQEAQEQAPQEEQAFNYSNMAWADVE